MNNYSTNYNIGILLHIHLRQRVKTNIYIYIYQITPVVNAITPQTVCLAAKVKISRRLRGLYSFFSTARPNSDLSTKLRLIESDFVKKNLQSEVNVGEVHFLN